VRSGGGASPLIPEEPYFCDDIRQDLDAETLNERIAVINAIVQSFSMEKLNQTSTRFYRGRSMSGTFHPGDCLIVESTALANIRIGDVIVYRGTNHDGEEDVLVHRIVASTPNGLVTRGDNNPRVDTTLVTAENLLGRVTHVERNGITRPVRGGRLGLLHARLFRFRLSVWKFIKRLGREPYRRLRNSNLIPRLWQPNVTTLRFDTEKGSLVKYICGGRVVARWWQQQNRFECDKPYDLVIPRPDEK
jgi:signal peptidase I